MSDADASRWCPAWRADALAAGQAKVLKVDGQQVAVFRVADGSLHAVDNRCPHEGYPLVQGDTKDCVLTCKWHNYKFDLRTGACLMGDEDVRTFPVRVVDGEIQVDLRPPDPAVAAAAMWRSLRAGLHDASMGRVARDVVRLLQLGVPSADIALAGAIHDATRGEWGATHGLPVAADVLRWRALGDGVDMALPLVQALEIAARPHVRQVDRPLAPPVVPVSDPDETGLALREAVEAEDATRAEGLLRGAIQAGWGREIVEPWLYRLCADHFLDYGHALIYQVKVFDLLAEVGWHHADALLPAHLYGIVCGTREDTLPAWAPFHDYVDGIEAHLPSLHRQAAGTATWTEASAAAVASFRTEVLDGDQRQALSAVIGALHSGVALPQVIDQLTLAAAERVLRFDAGIDADPTVQNGWLGVTHVLTFVAAVRRAAQRWQHPDLLRLLLQAARFVNRTGPLDGDRAARRVLEHALRPPPSAGPVGLDQVLAAVGAQDAEGAVALAARFADGPPAHLALGRALMAHVVQDRAATAIVVAHQLKVVVAAIDEAAAARHALPLLAAVRFVASPVSERRLSRATHEAVRFVVDGKVPRNLVS